MNGGSEIATKRRIRSNLLFVVVQGSVHRNNILIYIQQDATLHGLFCLETALHVSGGTITHHQERKQLSTASGICHTVIAICRYGGRVGAGLSVLWVAYAVYAFRDVSLLTHGNSGWLTRRDITRWLERRNDVVRNIVLWRQQYRCLLILWHHFFT